jgi:hypothetical protein
MPAVAPGIARGFASGIGDQMPADTRFTLAWALSGGAEALVGYVEQIG